MPKKLKGGDPLGFFNIHSVAKHPKKAGGLLGGGKYPKKNVSQCRKELKGGPFWSSSLGQMVQFDTIIFGRTFKNYFGQFVWIEKKESL